MQEDLLENVALIGAAGKMGRGIAQLFLLEMAKLSLNSPKKRRLVLLDQDEGALNALKPFLKQKLILLAEEKISQIRSHFAKREDLISNEEMIEAFVEEALSILWLTTDFHSTLSCSVVCEAAVEDLQVKGLIFSHYQESKALLYTNTSSIPISEIALLAGVEGRLAGLHFYNPPPLQKLLEIIIPKGCSSAVKKGASTLAEAFGKTVVFSADKPGFIGNGHFLREIAYALELVEESKNPAQTIWDIDVMTREKLNRPMGIFQVMDYVGLDVAQKIAKVMGLSMPLLEKFPQGGQNLDGSQKNGFFTYEKRTPISVYDTSLEKYCTAKVNEMGEEEFLAHSRAFQQELVDLQIAKSIEDVKTVLEKGFYHGIT